MSINWVMLNPSQTFIPLPNETTLHTTPPRITLEITSPSTYPAHALSLKSDNGILYITSQRVIYLSTLPLPGKAAGHITSFSTPLARIQDSRVVAPWFGPNAFVAAVLPVAGGGLDEGGHGVVEVKFTFKEGGAYEFASVLGRVRERLGEIREIGGESGEVHLEELPVYEEGGVSGGERGREEVREEERVEGGREERAVPDEAPPGYEEGTR